MEEATWTQVRMVIPFDVDRDRVNDGLVTYAYAERLSVGIVYAIAYKALALGVPAGELLTFVMVHIALARDHGYELLDELTRSRRSG
jgi:hypothetical protein